MANLKNVDNINKMHACVLQCCIVRTGLVQRVYTPLNLNRPSAKHKLLKHISPLLIP